MEKNIMTSTNNYTIGKVMQLIPLNEEAVPFNIDFYLKGSDDFHFAIVDQNQLDEGTKIDFKQSDSKEVSGNINSSEDLRSYYIGLKSIAESTEISVSIASKPLPPPPAVAPPPQQQQRRPPPQPQQQRRPPPQQQQQRRPPPQQQQQRRPPPQQQQQRRPPPQQQQRRPPPQQQQRRPPPQQQQQRRPPMPVQNDVRLTRPNDSKNLVLYIGGGVAIIAIGFAIWYMFIRKKKPSNDGGVAKNESGVEGGASVESLGEKVAPVLSSAQVAASASTADLLSKLKSLPESRRSVRR